MATEPLPVYGIWAFFGDLTEKDEPRRRKQVCRALSNLGAGFVSPCTSAKEIGPTL